MKTPSQIKNYHERLGISKDACKEEIKKAYIKLTKIYHPNNYPLDDEPKQKECHLEFIAIGEAYESLIRGKNKSSYQNINEEEQFNYFKDLYGVTVEDFERITKIMSKDENPRVRTIARLMNKVLDKFF
ncbi:DnaJ domain-containing protein [Candidatus Pacearchaeota archaeon]|nr:DnaJ domain-containing protein [Candidatus Pacearchaeota archaeon]